MIFKRKKAGDKPVKLERITAKNVEEHRSEVLKKAKKFKYPLQYSTHKVLIRTIIISVFSLIVVTVGCWFMIYKQQNDSDLILRLTSIIPVPAAQIEGETVRYSDYVLRVRNITTYLYKYDEEFLKTDEESQKSIINNKKRTELDTLEKYALAKKIAKEQNITVSNAEVNDFIDKQRGEVSLAVYETSILQEYFNWSIDDYKIFVHDQLLLQKVSSEIDTDAFSEAEKLLGEIQADTGKFDQTGQSEDNHISLNKVVEQDISANNDISGIIAVAKDMEVGQISSVIKGADGCYIIKLDAKTDKKVSFSTIKVAYRELDDRFDSLKKNNKIQEYITVN